MTPPLAIAQRASRVAEKRFKWAQIHVIRSTALIEFWRKRKPLAKAASRAAVSSLCRAGDHLWCGGLAYLDPRNLSRRAPCACACKHLWIRTA